MIFRELSNAAFRFFLRRPGAEIMGGRSNAPPPPPAGGGKSRGPAGRGLIGFAHISLKTGFATLLQKYLFGMDFCLAVSIKAI